MYSKLARLYIFSASICAACLGATLRMLAWAYVSTVVLMAKITVHAAQWLAMLACNQFAACPHLASSVLYIPHVRLQVGMCHVRPGALPQPFAYAQRIHPIKGTDLGKASAFCSTTTTATAKSSGVLGVSETAAAGVSGTVSDMQLLPVLASSPDGLVCHMLCMEPIDASRLHAAMKHLTRGTCSSRHGGKDAESVNDSTADSMTISSCGNGSSKQDGSTDVGTSYDLRAFGNGPTAASPTDDDVTAVVSGDYEAASTLCAALLSKGCYT